MCVCVKEKKKWVCDAFRMSVGESWTPSGTLSFSDLSLFGVCLVPRGGVPVAAGVGDVGVGKQKPD